VHLRARSEVTLHSKKATQSKQINANCYYNNIQCYTIPSTGKAVQYPNNQKRSSGTHVSRYQGLEKEQFLISLLLHAHSTGLSIEHRGKGTGQV
jgi:hypothetical protein